MKIKTNEIRMRFTCGVDVCLRNTSTYTCISASLYASRSQRYQMGGTVFSKSYRDYQTAANIVRNNRKSYRARKSLSFKLEKKKEYKENNTDNAIRTSCDLLSYLLLFAHHEATNTMFYPAKREHDLDERKRACSVAQNRAIHSIECDFPS